ncbi:MAG TPA: serine hydrolase domain-containing protein [Candidatus Limnocylindria bacterium]|jgi:CubicO group peptidase (beta-lactamase class C family)|nr:serine hydrolase domain-containing protein [Candidatus Limnocylindria bacterium]
MKSSLPLFYFFTSVTAFAADSSPITVALQPFVDRHELAGAVAVVANSTTVLHVDSVGYAEIASRRPMTADTMFWIASQSKPITATALMMLVDEGKVNLDDPVEKYLPEFRSLRILKVIGLPGNETMEFTPPEKKLLVRHVLSHTGGLPFSSAIETPTLDRYPLALRVRSYALQPLNAEPGTVRSYSNAGINIAGRIIEVVSGMPYEDFLRQRIFEPLGMRDTTFWPNEEQSRRIAMAYRPALDGQGSLRPQPTTQLQWPVSDRKHRYPMPAGGLFSTARDVARFCQFILNQGIWEGKRFLSSVAISEMTSNQVLDDDWSYGLGWFVEAKNGRIGHGGADGTAMWIYPSKHLFTVWMVAGAQGESRSAFEKAVPELAPQP